MPRIPYVFPPAGESLAADKLRERRKDGKLIPLDGVFLNAPAIASGYSSLLRAIRQENSLDDGLKELLVSLVMTAKMPSENVSVILSRSCVWLHSTLRPMNGASPQV